MPAITLFKRTSRRLTGLGREHVKTLRLPFISLDYCLRFDKGRLLEQCLVTFFAVTPLDEERT